MGNLEDCSMSDQSVLLQYADDLLVASNSGYYCIQDSLRLLPHLCEQGHRLECHSKSFSFVRLRSSNWVLKYPKGKDNLDPKENRLS